MKLLVCLVVAVLAAIACAQSGSSGGVSFLVKFPGDCSVITPDLIIALRQTIADLLGVDITAVAIVSIQCGSIDFTVQVAGADAAAAAALALAVPEFGGAGKVSGATEVADEDLIINSKPCLLEPCKNKAGCKELFDDVMGIPFRSCTCAPGYFGDNCEHAARHSGAWKEYRGNMYLHVASPKLEYGDAAKACRGIGANLASINSKGEDEFVSTLAEDEKYNIARWIGLAYSQAKAGFVWNDRNGVNYANWYPGAPRAEDGECVYQDSFGATLGWRNDRCATKRRYVCEIENVKKAPSTTAAPTKKSKKNKGGKNKKRATTTTKRATTPAKRTTTIKRRK